MKGDQAPEIDLARGLVGIRVSHRNLEGFCMGFPGIYSRAISRFATENSSFRWGKAREMMGILNIRWITVI